MLRTEYPNQLQSAAAKTSFGLQRLRRACHVVRPRLCRSWDRNGKVFQAAMICWVTYQTRNRHHFSVVGWFHVIAARGDAHAASVFLHLLRGWSCYSPKHSLSFVTHWRVCFDYFLHKFAAERYSRWVLCARPSRSSSSDSATKRLTLAR